MLVINEHPIETIEDVFWVFEPDEMYLEKELMDTYDYMEPRGSRAVWCVDKLNTKKPFFEINYDDNQTDIFTFWYRLVDKEAFVRKDNESLDKLVGSLWKWFIVNRPDRPLVLTTQPPPALIPWEFLKGAGRAP
jgi:hypothetical protein